MSTETTETVDSRAAQLAIARAALSRLATPEPLNEADPAMETASRCDYAAGTLATMGRLAEPAPSMLAAVRAEVLASVAADWTINPSTGRSNSSDEFRRLTGEVRRLLAAAFPVLDAGHVRRAAGVIMAQLAHVHGLVPRGMMPQEGRPAAVVDRDDLRLALEHVTPGASTPQSRAALIRLAEAAGEAP